MNWLIYFAGIATGILLTIACNYFFPAKVDAATKKAADAVKDKLD